MSRENEQEPRTVDATPEGCDCWGSGTCSVCDPEGAGPRSADAADSETSRTMAECARGNHMPARHGEPCPSCGLRSNEAPSDEAEEALRINGPITNEGVTRMREWLAQRDARRSRESAQPEEETIRRDERQRCREYLHARADEIRAMVDAPGNDRQKRLHLISRNNAFWDAGDELLHAMPRTAKAKP